MEKLTREAYLQKINFDFTNDTYKWKYITALNLDCELSSTEIRLMIILLNLYNSEKGYAFPSQNKLKTILGLGSRNTVQKYIDNLVNRGYLKAVKVFGKVNHYRPVPFDVEDNKFLKR